MLDFSANGATPGRAGSDKTAYVRGFDKYQDEDSVRVHRVNGAAAVKVPSITVKYCSIQLMLPL